MFCRHTKPGGWIEIQEDDICGLFSDDDTYKVGGGYDTYNQALREGGIQAGRRLDIVEELKGKAIAAGFVNVKEMKYKWPIGTWPKDPHFKELGRWGIEVLDSGCEAYGLALFTRVMGMDEKSARALVNRARSDVKNGAIHMCLYK